MAGGWLCATCWLVLTPGFGAGFLVVELRKDAQVLETVRPCRLRHGRSFRVGGPRA